MKEILVKEILENTTFNKNFFSVLEKTNDKTVEYNFWNEKKGKGRILYNDEMRKNIVAIIVGRMLYIANMSLFEIRSKQELKYNGYDNIFLLQDIVRHKNRYIKYIFFSEYIDELPSSVKTLQPILSIDETNCEIKAPKEISLDKDIFCEQDVIDFLCGTKNIDAEAERLLNKERNYWIMRKRMATQAGSN